MKTKNFLFAAIAALITSSSIALPAFAREAIFRSSVPGGRVDLYTSTRARHLAACSGVDGQQVNVLSASEENGQRWYFVVVDDCGVGFVQDDYIVFTD
jgi:hypothetical protein